MDRVVDVGEQTAVTVFNPSTSLLGGVMVDDSPLWLAWEGARAAWLESKRRRSGGPNTVRMYTWASKKFFDWAGVAPWAVSPVLAQNWVAALSDEVSDTTINLLLAALSSFYEFVQRRYTARTADGREVTLWPADRRNPFDAVERAKVSPYGRAKFPTTNECKQLLDAIHTESVLGKRDFALLFTILVTCRRSSEVLNIRWGDIQELGDGNFSFAYRYKGGDRRRAVLPKECFDIICAYLTSDGRPPETMQPDDYLFIPMDAERITRMHKGAPVIENRPISNSQANKILQKYGRRVGVAEEKCHIHGLRHAGARLRVQQAKASGKGVDYAEIMSLLGHSSLAVTQIYSTTLLEDPEDPGGKAAAMELLPKGARRRKKEPKAEQGTLL